MKKYYIYIKYAILGSLVVNIAYILFFLITKPFGVTDVSSWLMFTVLGFGWITMIASPMVTYLLFSIVILYNKREQKNMVALANIIFSVPFSLISLLFLLYVFSPR